MSKSNPIPKYYSIAPEIINGIKEKKYLPGMKIPSENEIIDLYKMSNTTARKALQEIENGGWVQRIKGKGTFVHKHGVIRSADRILSFTNNMLEMGYTPGTKVLNTSVENKGYTDTINGRKYYMKGPVYKIQRLRLADDIPMMLETRYVSAELCPKIINRPLNGSLWEIYSGKYGRKIKEDHQMLSTVMIDRETCGYFNLPEPIPGILVRGVAFCGKEIILEMEESLYRGDKYSFAVRAYQS